MAGPKYEIAPNEELIGVYGIKDEFRHLTGLGFIVKEVLQSPATNTSNSNPEKS